MIFFGTVLREIQYINCSTDWWYKPLKHKFSFSKPREGYDLSTICLHQEKQMTGSMPNQS